MGTFLEQSKPALESTFSYIHTNLNHHFNPLNVRYWNTYYFRIPYILPSWYLLSYFTQSKHIDVKDNGFKCI